MSKSNSAPFVCDNCGTTKTGEADARWRILVRTSLMDVPGAAIYEWDDSLASLKNVDHACGDRCTSTLVERHLALETSRREIAKKFTGRTVTA